METSSPAPVQKHDEPLLCGGMSCADDVGRALLALSGRWAFVVLETLYLQGGASRFRDLQRAIGKISQKELTRQLTNLVGASVVQRVVSSEQPAAVVYRVTEEGLGLLRRLQTLGEWARDVRSAQEAPLVPAQPDGHASWLDPIARRTGTR